MYNIIIAFRIYLDAGVRWIKLSGIGISSNPKWEREKERERTLREMSVCMYVRE